MSGVTVVTVPAVGALDAAVVAYVAETIRGMVDDENAKTSSKRGGQARVAERLGQSSASINQWVRGKRVSLSRELEQNVAKLQGLTVDMMRQIAFAKHSDTVHLPPMVLQALGVLAMRRPGVDFRTAARSIEATHKPEEIDAETLATLIEEIQAGGGRDAGLDVPTGLKVIHQRKRRP